MYAAVVILLLVTSLFFLVQTPSFQTWLAQKAADYLQDELNSEISIQKVDIDFFKTINLKGVFVKDRNGDTLLNEGNLAVRLNTFNYEGHEIDIKEILLENTTVNIKIPKKDSVLNYQFIIDYFKSGTKPPETGGGAWKITFNDLLLNHVNFVYQNENKSAEIHPWMNYNFIRVNDIKGKFTAIAFNGDTIQASIFNLSAREQCGFMLTNLSCNARVSSNELLVENLYLETPGTRLDGKLRFNYRNWSSFNDFVNAVDMNAEFGKHSKLHLADIAHFTEEVYGLKDTVRLTGQINGTVSNLHLKKFKLQLKHHTEFIGDLALTGLPDIQNSYLHMDAKKLSTSYIDLASVPAYPFHKGEYQHIPAEIKALGFITFTGKFDGILNDFTLNGKITTQLGSVFGDIGLRKEKKPYEISYHGKIIASQFNLGELFGLRDFNNLTTNISIKGRGYNINTIDAVLEGNVNSITFNGYKYSNIKLDGTFFKKSFNGLMVSTDPNADFDFNGSINFEQKMPQMDFISTVNKLDLYKLNFTKEPAEFSTQILITLNGDNLNNLTGDINFDNTFYKTQVKTYKISTFDLNMNQESVNKTIHLTSNYFNADLEGPFELSQLPFSFRQVLHAYYPTFVLKNKGKTIYKDAFKFKLNIKRFDLINELFVNSLKVSNSTQITGDFDASKNLFNFNLKSPLIDFNGIKFNNNVIESYSKNNKINLVFKGSNIQLTDSVRLENYFMYLVSKDLETKYNLEWANKEIPVTSGKLFGFVNFSNNQAIFKFNEFRVTAKDSTWNLTEVGMAVADTGGKVVIHPLYFKNNQQEIGISGVVSNSKNDSLLIETKNLQLDQFNPLLSAFKINLNGDLSGNIKLQNADKHFTLNSDLNFQKFKFNNNLVGELSIKSNYLSNEKRVELEGFTSLGLTNMFGFREKNLTFKGNYYLDRKEESIDITFGANPLNLKLLSPLLKGILTINNGFAKGNGKIHGTPENIKIDGGLNIFKSEIKVDYTNVTYNMTGQIEIMPDQIRFSDILMYSPDSKAAPQGTINGNIFHNNFKQMQLDYDITYRNMLVLNTTIKENPSFYGKIYGSGNIGIWGYINDIHMQVRDTTTRNSKFVLPLDGPEEVAENDFISFVNKDTIEKAVSKPITGFNLDLNIVATPDATTQIIFDKTNNDAISVNGNGNITMKINTYGKFDMFGDYIISGGEYNFSLEKVINKRFDIDGGSSIIWSGNPYDADINIIASYRQRASVAPLINDISGTYKGRTPAAVKLKMTDKLMKPDISFALEFPSIADNIRSQINSVLADEQELNRQVFSFLLFRSFVPPLIYNATGGGVTAGSAAASTGTEFLSNRLNNMLDNVIGNIAGNLQVGLNYRAGNQTNNDEVLMNVNKNFLDDKLTVDGNFGVGSTARGGNRNIIGDVNIEYKLSDDGRYKLKGFNRTNDNTQLITTGGLYTQGIGFFFREEFDTFNELYKRYLDKIKKAKD
jgi:hypothetical protein